MNLGLSQSEIDFIKNNLRNKLPSNTTVWVFGSRVRGNYQEFSDLDLMIESKLDLSREIGNLNEIFIDSNLVIKIDLVHISNFAKSYLENYEKEKKIFLRN